MFLWITKPEDRERLVQAITTIGELYAPWGRVYASDHLITVGRQLGFYDEPKLIAAFDDIAARGDERAIQWRLHTLIWAARHALTLPGDFVECGVATALSTAVTARMIDFAAVAKTWFLYDAWGGAGAIAALKEEARRLYANPRIFEIARRRCAPFANITLVPGLIPDVFARGAPERVAFLHIDLNNVAAEIAALDHLFDRVVPGGLIVFDDYGWRADYRDQKPAVDAFMTARGHMVLELPTGQGLVIKH